MPTTVTHSIGTSGRDYSTLQAWEDACPANLVTSDQIWKGEVYNDSEFSGSSGVTQILFSGVTTDATRFLWLTAAAGQSFADHADKLTNPLKYDQSKGVGLRITGNYSIHVVNSGVNKVVVERLQFFYDSTYSSNYYQPVSWSGGGIFRDCLIESRRTNNRIFQCISSIGGYPTDVVNVTVIDRGSAGCLAFADFTPSGVTCRFTNCTALRPTDLATGGTGFTGSGAYNQSILRNCAVVGAFTNATADTFATASCGNNATTVGTMPGSGSLSGLTASSLLEGVISSGIDARVKAGSDLIGAASVQSAYTNDLDIVGRARNTVSPTIGAWEYVWHSDDFNRANETPIAAPWSSVSGFNTINLTGNAVAAGTPSTNCGIRNASSARLSSQVKLTVRGDYDCGPATCLSGSGNGYGTTAGNGLLELFRFDLGTPGLIGTAAGTYAADDVLRLRREGNNVIFSINGVDKITATDTTHMTGNPGLTMWDGTSRLDDWTDDGELVLSQITPDGRLSGTSAAATFVFPQDIAVGDLILVPAAVYVSGGASLASGDVTDTLGNTYALIQSVNYNGARTALYWCRSAFAGACTVTWDNAQTVYLAGTCAAFPGIAASPVGASHSVTGSSSTPAIGPVAQTENQQADSLIVAVLGVNTGSADAGIDAATTGYINADREQSGASYMGFSFDYKSVSSIAQQSAAWGTLASSMDWAALLVEFKNTTVGPTIDTYPRYVRPMNASPTIRRRIARGMH